MSPISILITLQIRDEREDIQCEYESKELCQIFTQLMRGNYHNWKSQNWKGWLRGMGGKKNIMRTESTKMED